MIEGLRILIHESVVPFAAVLTLSGFVLAVVAFMNWHGPFDIWVKEKAPSPTSVLFALGILLFLLNLVLDTLLGFLALMGLGLPFIEWFSGLIRPILIAVLAIFVTFSMVYCMARSKGGFVSAVALVLAAGSALTLFGLAN